MRLAFALVFVFGITFLKAQTPSTVLDVEKGRCRSFPVSDGSRLTCFVQNEDTLHFFVYDSNLTLIKKGYFGLEDKAKKGCRVWEAALLYGKPTLLLMGKDHRSFSTLSFNAYSFEKQIIANTDLPKGDNYIASFDASNIFYLICLRCGKTNCDLVIKEMKPGQPATEHVINSKDIPLGITADRWLWGMFIGYVEVPMADIKITRLKKVSPQDNFRNYDVRTSCRFYATDSQLVITFNSIPDTAQVLTVNLHSFEATVIKVASGKQSSDKYFQYINNNVFLMDNKILYLAVYKKELCFKIFDAITGNMLKEYITKADVPAGAMAGGFKPFVLDKKEDEEADKTIKTSTLLNKVADDNFDPMVGIGAFINAHGQLTVTIALGHHHYRTTLNRNTLEPEEAKDYLSPSEKAGQEIRYLKSRKEFEAITNVLFRGNEVMSYFSPEAKSFNVKVLDREKK